MEKFYYGGEVKINLQGQIFIVKFYHISCPNFTCSSLNFEPNLTNEKSNERAVFVD